MAYESSNMTNSYSKLLKTDIWVFDKFVLFMLLTEELTKMCHPLLKKKLNLQRHKSWKNFKSFFWHERIELWSTATLSFNSLALGGKMLDKHDENK